MLEIKFIRENLEIVQNALRTRGQAADLDTFQTCDNERRTILQELEALRHQRNMVSDQIAEMKKSGEDAETLVAQMRDVSSRIKELEKAFGESEEMLEKILMGLPNIPHSSVPVGKDESQNPVIKTVGKPPQFTFNPKPHWDIGTELGILDFERAAKIAGARFPLYFGAGARLERALINFMLDKHTQFHGYTETLPPFIVNRQAMMHTGQLPKFEADLWFGLLPDTHSRSAGDQHSSGRDPQGRATADLLYRLYTLFPLGGRFIRERYPGADPPAPVQ